MSRAPLPTIGRLAAVAALVICWPASAGAHPGHGAEPVTVEGDAFRYAPATVTIALGDTVVWSWLGAISRNHSVTSDPGQTESFDSDPDQPPTNASHQEGDFFTHTFSHEGRFTYHCQVHPSMTGVVEVIPVPASAGPLRLSGLRVSVDRKRVQARFGLSKPADLAARFSAWRKHSWRTVKTFNRKGRRGKNKLKFDLGSLESGRYRLSLRAYDETNRRAEAEEPFSL